MAEKKLNLGIDDGNNFFAHEVSVSFNPTQFILDFKCITPRIDPRTSSGDVLSLKHNVVMMDVYHAKAFADFLQKRLKDFEKEFGKIEKPKAIKKAEKKASQRSAKEKAATAETPNYFG